MKLWVTGGSKKLWWKGQIVQRNDKRKKQSSENA